MLTLRPLYISLQYGSWDGRASIQVERERENRGSHITFYNLALEVMHWHSHCILFLEKVTMFCPVSTAKNSTFRRGTSRSLQKKSICNGIHIGVTILGKKIPSAPFDYASLAEIRLKQCCIFLRVWYLERKDIHLTCLGDVDFDLVKV